MSDPTSYHAPNLRITNREKKHQFINDQILAVVKGPDAKQMAEKMWLALKENKIEISMASFNTRLKKLVGSGKVQKHSIGYNKYEYWLAAGKGGNY